MRLEGRIALVTGAARGIGAAIAAAFAAEGAQVVATDIAGAHGTPLPADDPGRLDVRSEADWRRVIDAAVARHGRMNVLVNNAGITGFETDEVGPHDPEHGSLADWRAVHAVNLDGVFLGCKHAIQAMRATGTEGCIIDVSSRSGLVGIPAAAAYASSKAAVRNHTRTVALWCAQQGLPIRCNAILPAAILTPMWEPMLGGPDRQARMAALVADTPLRRFGRPEEVAAVAVLLASGEATYMTGAEIVLDGGLLAGSAAVPAASG